MIVFQARQCHGLWMGHQSLNYTLDSGRKQGVIQLKLIFCFQVMKLELKAAYGIGISSIKVLPPFAAKISFIYKK